MWLAMTAVMMAPVVYPWLRALHVLTNGPRPGSAPAGRRDAPQPAPGGSSVPADGSSPVAVVPFAAGYAVAWAGFSTAAATLHAALGAAGLPVPLWVHAPVAAATVLIVAGAFQFTGLKESCLVHCRSPAGYLLAHWRGGAAGWARLGLRHGLYCVGCCWALMALALVVGMASLAWMGAMAAFMAAETALPFGHRLARPAGAVLLAAGTAMLVA